MANFYSVLSSVIIGCLFVYIFMITYDFLYGEKQEKQIKKLHKYFVKETITNIKMTEHVPRKYTSYNVYTINGIQKMKMKPGYKVVKIVAPKDHKANSKNRKVKDK